MVFAGAGAGTIGDTTTKAIGIVTLVLTVLTFTFCTP
jgi:hypothetical protein